MLVTGVMVARTIILLINGNMFRDENQIKVFGQRKLKNKCFVICKINYNVLNKKIKLSLKSTCIPRGGNKILFALARLASESDVTLASEDLDSPGGENMQNENH